MKKAIGNLVALLLSTLVALIFSEAAFRVVLDPIDFLQPDLVADQRLNHKIRPGSGGHDQWGFRNDSVPESTAVLAVGDSMTYGVSAPLDGAWPQQLATTLGRPVYNMALGGYGPLQYLHLLRSKGPALNPDVVIVGFYFGNDLMDAYNLAYGNDHWSEYRASGVEPAPIAPVVDLQAGNRRFLGSFRAWLSQNSLLYSIVARSFLGDLVREQRTDLAGSTLIDVPGGETRLEVAKRLSALDLADGRIHEGLRITKMAIRQMAAESRSQNAELVLLLIPTKERVYADEGIGQEGGDSVNLQRLVEFETTVQAQLKELGDALDVTVVDVTAPLSLAADKQMVYPAYDGHPNSIGYAVISQTVARAVGGD